MISAKRDLILRELARGTGAAVCATVSQSGLRPGLRIWFADLDEKHGPVANLKPFGLRGYRVELSFGNFAGEVVAQIQNASGEDVQLARALVRTIRPGVEVEVASQELGDWKVVNGAFRMTATLRDLERADDDAAVAATCREVIVPMMAAMAELIGYDVVEDPAGEEVPAFEGAILQSVVRRRERNPRNRLLCLRVHGELCFGCGVPPSKTYGDDAGSILEVHHLEPLALLAAPRPYDPATDLVPLCPNCHRAVHTRRPIPITIEELRNLVKGNHARTP